MPSPIFTTPELLHQIILNLPVRSTFGIERVCRQWRECVQKSVLIQAKLRPNVEEEEHWSVFPHAELLQSHTRKQCDGRACTCHAHIGGDICNKFHALPIVPNSGILDFVPTAQESIFEVGLNDLPCAEGIVLFNTSKVNESSSCLDLALTKGPGFFRDIFLSGYLAGSGNPFFARLPAKVNGLVTFGDIWRAALSHGADFNRNLRVKLDGAVWTTEEMLNSVRANGAYHLPLIAQRQDGGLRAVLAQHLDFRDWISLRNADRSMRRLINPRLHPEVYRFEYLSVKPTETWVIRTDEDLPVPEILLYSEDARLDALKPKVTNLMQLRYGTEANHTICKPVVYNGLFLEQTTTHRLSSAAKGGYSILSLKKGVEKMTCKSICGKMRAVKGIVTALKIEVASQRGTKGWEDINVGEISSWSVRELVKRIVERGGTGRIMLPDQLATSVKDWVEAEDKPMLTQSGVLQEIDNLARFE